MMMRGESVDDQNLIPYYRGFKGRIQEKPKGGYITKGSYKFTSISQMEVTELPTGVWTDNYKEYLESILIDTYKSTSCKKKKMVKRKNHQEETKVLQ